MFSGDGSGGVVMLVDGDVQVAIWRLDGLACPDLLVVDTLARLQLTAKRMGWSIRLHNTSEELRGLLDLVGLADVLAVADEARLPLEPGGKAEGGEQFRVEEVVEPGDPVA
ncbi:MAG: STAS domain-containing protein [Acidimicrobiales bacterium]